MARLCKPFAKRTGPDAPDSAIRSVRTIPAIRLSRAVKRTSRYTPAWPEAERMSEDAKFALGF
jgi:hypothetical protein